MFPAGYVGGTVGAFAVTDEKFPFITQWYLILIGNDLTLFMVMNTKPKYINTSEAIFSGDVIFSYALEVKK